jgi:putative transposase
MSKHRYVRLSEAFVYLAVVLDAFSRKVVGWAMADHLRAELALDALQMALDSRQVIPGGLVHHSDRGPSTPAATTSPGSRPPPSSPV